MSVLHGVVMDVIAMNPVKVWGEDSVQLFIRCRHAPHQPRDERKQCRRKTQITANVDKRRTHIAYQS